MSTTLPPKLPPLWRRLLDTPFRELISEGPTGSTNWRVVLVEAAPPAPIDAVIHQVVRKSRLWKSERREVTEELLAHFQDGLDTGATPEELVASFGDPAVAARLIGRGKRRCRPLLWQLAEWLRIGLLVACVAYLAYGVCLMQARPIVTNELWATINGPIHSRPATEKAWPEYARLLEQIEEERPWNPPGKMPIQSAGGLMEGLSEYAFGFALGEAHQTAKQSEQLDAWLTEHADWLAELREAALKPSLGLGIGPSGDFPAEAAAVWGYSMPTEDEDLWKGSLFSSLHPQQNLRVLADWLLADADLAAAGRRRPLVRQRAIGDWPQPPGARARNVARQVDCGSDCQSGQPGSGGDAQRIAEALVGGPAP